MNNQDAWLGFTPVLPLAVDILIYWYLYCTAVFVHRLWLL